MPLLLAVVVLIAAEVAALVLVASHVGVLATLGLLVLGTVVGGWLVRREGTRAWRALAVAVSEGRPPGREALDGFLVLIGGLLILLPGFVSDVLGLLCLLPPTRRLLGRVVIAYIAYTVRRGTTTTVVRVRSRRGDGTPSATAGAGQPVPGEPGPGSAPRDRTRPPGTGRIIEGELAAPPDERPPDSR